MNKYKTLKGECLCGQVSWELSGPYEFFGMCQCSRCRKVTGAAFATNLFVKADQFNWISGEDNTGKYALEPPNTFGNAFCSKSDNYEVRFGTVLSDLGGAIPIERFRCSAVMEISGTQSRLGSSQSDVLCIASSK